MFLYISFPNRLMCMCAPAYVCLCWCCMHTLFCLRTHILKCGYHVVEAVTSSDGLHYRGSRPMEVHSADLSVKLSLPIFGLAYYKFKVSVWNPNGAYECQKANSLLRAADNWLRLLQVNHPDYSFFVSHNSNWR